MKIDIPVSQPYRVDIAPGLLDDLGRYVSSGTAALVVTEEHVEFYYLIFYNFLNLLL